MNERMRNKTYLNLLNKLEMKAFLVVKRVCLVKRVYLVKLVYLGKRVILAKRVCLGKLPIGLKITTKENKWNYGSIHSEEEISQ